MMKRLQWALLIGVVLLTSGCTGITPSYVRLAMIEPERELTNRYIDDVIDIYFEQAMRPAATEGVTNGQGFGFRLANVSPTATARLLWDEATYVDIEGKPGPVRHTEVAYSPLRKDSQDPTIIPPGAHITDIAIPARNWVWANNKWEIAPLLPLDLKYGFISKTEIEQYNGKVMVLLLPIEVNGVRRDYLFRFRIDIVPKSQ